METLVGLVCRAPGAASEHGGGVCPSPFDVFPGGQACGPSGAGADALRGPSVPEGPSPALGRPQRGDLAPGSAGLTPGQKGGVPAAIKVAKEMGDQIHFQGVRIDSGDMAYISKKVREQLDDAGFTAAKIYASNDLDENTILNLKMQKAKIDVWGVGTKLITAYDQPALGAVYKIVSIETETGEMRDTIKLSSNAEKVSTPGKKQVWRIRSLDKNKSEGGYITFADVDPNQLDEIVMFHPTYTYIKKRLKNFTARPLLVPIFDKGQLIYEVPSLSEIKAYFNDKLDDLWDEYKRDLNPQDYPVDLAQEVWDNKMKLIDEVRKDVYK